MCEDYAAILAMVRTVILVEDMVERALSVFHWDGHRLTEAAPLPMGAGPAGIGTAWP